MGGMTFGLVSLGWVVLSGYVGDIYAKPGVRDRQEMMDMVLVDERGARVGCQEMLARSWRTRWRR